MASDLSPPDVGHGAGGAATGSPRRRRPVLRALALAGLGLALVVGLLVRADTAEVVAALERAGPWAAGVALLHVVALALDALAWRRLLERSLRPGLGRVLGLRWVAEGVNNLLPVARVGGDLARALLLARAGVSAATAAASVVVDMAVGVLAEALLALLALATLARASDAEGLPAAAAGLLLAAVPLAALLYAGRRGWLAASASRLAFAAVAPKLRGVAGDAALFGRAVDALAGDLRALWVCGSLRALSALAAALELWVGLVLIGSAASPREAFVLQALTTVARSAAFLIPGGLGVQEGAFVAVAAPLGLTASEALALALLVRARELALGAPALVVAWMFFRAPHAVPADEQPGPAQRR